MRLTFAFGSANRSSSSSSATSGVLLSCLLALTFALGVTAVTSSWNFGVKNIYLPNRKELQILFQQESKTTEFFAQLIFPIDSFYGTTFICIDTCGYW